MNRIWTWLLLLFAGSLAVSALLNFSAHAPAGLEEAIGHRLPLSSVVPFILMLLAIALVPLFAPYWWEENRNKAMIAGGLALPVFFLFLQLEMGSHALWNVTHEFFSFLVLLGALFTISGGIHLRGDLKATPWTNTGFLAAGGILASLIGTTGASMLLIRPLLSTNREREHTRHVFLFFLFLVANAGGLLTPLGDPPLFLGFLRGVPFFWTLHLWKEWLFMMGALLALFYFLDQSAYRKENPAHRLADQVIYEPLRLSGHAHLFLLGGVVAVVIFAHGPHTWMREPALVGLAALSYGMDLQRRKGSQAAFCPRLANRFNFHPIVEVAVLFAGIFITMLPALCLLKARGSELGITRPWHFFWMSGLLSSFLDNAPTYATFFALGQGLASQQGLCQTTAGLGGCVAQTGVPWPLLEAISLGSVLMGANTYIGNAPNFMIKTIVEQSGVKMPSFFGYMAYAGMVLFPAYLFITFFFLQR